MEKDLNIHEVYQPMFKDWNDLKLFTHYYGGRYAGKTFNINLAIIYQLANVEKLKGIYFRQSASTIGDSIKSGLQSAVDILGLGNDFNFIGNELIHRNGSSIKLKGVQAARLNDDSKHKGYDGIDFMVFEEFQDMVDGKLFDKIVLSARGHILKESKIICLYNPTSTQSWIYKKWFATPTLAKLRDDSEMVFVSYLLNLAHVQPAHLKVMDNLKKESLVRWKNEIMGEWTSNVTGQIYKDWETYVESETGYTVMPGTDKQYEIDFEDLDIKIKIGVDFGFTGDPCSITEYRYDGRNRFVKGIAYSPGLTNPDIAEIILEWFKLNNVPKTTPVICDSAEPKSIEELRRLGLNTIKAKKGPGSIEAGIKVVRTLKVFLHIDDTDRWTEFNQYCLRPNGKPIDKYNHFLDEFRYVEYTDSSDVRIISNNPRQFVMQKPKRNKAEQRRSSSRNRRLKRYR